MWKYKDRIIQVGRSWTDDEGTQWPWSWNRMSDEDKAGVGLVWEEPPAPPAPYDSEFYYSADNPKPLADVNVVDEDGNPVMDLDGNQTVQRGLKYNAIQDTKQTAHGMLAKYDWYALKEAETSEAMPESVATYRTAVRSASNTIEQSITAAADLDAFMALYDAPVDSDGNYTGNAPIYDWPTEPTV